MRRDLVLLTGALALVVGAADPVAAARPAAAAAPKPPVAKKIPFENKGGGHVRVDDYAWMHAKEDPEVLAHLEAENAHADAVMAPTARLQEKLYGEMLGRIQEDDTEVPYLHRGYYLYSRTEKGKQYRIHARKKGSLDAPEEVYLDVNALAEGKKYMAVRGMTWNEDNRLLAYSTDETGFRDYTLRVRDVVTGKELPDRAERVGSFAWATDGKTLFYTTTDKAKRPHKLWRHVLGQTGKDTLVFEEKDERYAVRVAKTRSRAYLLLTIASHTTSEVRVLRADQPTGTWRLVAPRKQDREYYLDHVGDRFFVTVNDTGRNFRVVTAPVADPGEKSWKEVIPTREDVMIEALEAFSTHVVLWERAGGLPRFRIVDLATGRSRDVPMAEAVYDVGADANAEFVTTTYRYGYESLTTPYTTYELDLGSFASRVLKRDPVPGYDPRKYTAERIHAVAADGTKIPISLVYKKGLVKNGKAPLYLKGYGAYGIPLAIAFDSNRVSLLDRGVVLAFAHIRGGGEMGKKWHDDGRLAKKENTFTDFIACAEHLVAKKYTSPRRLAVSGGSAGGLLMGAVLNARPELFRVALVYVPFVDVLSSMLDESLPLTVGEFEEWGNPKIPEQYAVMARYSPYDNVKAQAYPTMLVRTGLNDSQVMYFEPAKWVAKLRAMKTDKNPLLFKTNMAAGHGGKSGRYEVLRDAAYDYAFLLTQLGLGK